jgi:hypothetical protein
MERLAKHLELQQKAYAKVMVSALFESADWDAQRAMLSDGSQIAYTDGNLK